jgi:hypothetical protein
MVALGCGIIGDGLEEVVEWLPVGSCPEAAAEILAEPTAALVVDLRAVRGKDMQLLDLARQMGADIFAVGIVPDGVSAEDLSGVVLMSRHDLAGAIKALIGMESQAGRRELQEEQGEVRREPEDRGDKERSAETKPLTAEELGVRAVMDLISEAGEPPLLAAAAEVRPPVESTGPTGQERRPTAPSGTSPASLLTPEELSALLEDEQ